MGFGVWDLDFLKELVIDFDYLQITVPWASIKCAQSCEPSAFAGRVYPDRVTGRNRDHSDIGRDAAASLEQSQSQGAGNLVPQ